MGRSLGVMHFCRAAQPGETPRRDAICDNELAAFLTQHTHQQQQQQQEKQTSAGGKTAKQKPFSSFLATTLMLMAELAQVSQGFGVVAGLWH
jgi:hypothetical protein